VSGRPCEPPGATPSRGFAAVSHQATSGHPNCPTPPALTRVNQWISSEVLPAFYGQNSFAFTQPWCNGTRPRSGLQRWWPLFMNGTAPKHVRHAVYIFD
jgi:hypothetical protein